MSNIRIRKINIRPILKKRPRKLGICIYSPEGLVASDEGEKAIKCGETISQEEFCRREADEVRQRKLKAVEALFGIWADKDTSFFEKGN